MPIAVQSVSATATGTTSIVITKPSGVVDGDLMIAQIWDNLNFTNDYTTTPPGWTRIQDSVNDNDANGGGGMDTFYKVASSEGASYTWSKASDGNYIGKIVRIDGQSTTPLNTSSKGEDNTSDTTAVGTAITPTGYSLLLMFVGNSSTATTSGYSIATSDPGWTEAYDVQSGTNSIAMAYGIRPEVTPTSTVNATLSGSSKSITHLVSINANFQIDMPVLTLVSSMPDESADLSQTVVIPVMTVATSVPTPTATKNDRAERNLDKSSEGTWTTLNKS